MPVPVQYAGFWRRALALVVDGLIFVLFFVMQQAIAALSISAAIVSNVVLAALAAAYPVYFHARWGQTVGKMLAKIKVTRLDGTAIGLERAFLRSSVDITLSVFSTASLVYVMLTWTGPEWSSLGFAERGRLVGERNLARHWSFDTIMQAWVWGELLILLTNKKKRAAHDFIAGTVVVRTDQRLAETSPARLAMPPPAAVGLRQVMVAVLLVCILLVAYQLLFIVRAR